MTLSEALLKEKSVKPEDTAAWLTEYDELQTKGAEAFLQSRQKTVNTLKDDIEKTGFTLVPAGFLARWDDPQRSSGFCSRLRQFWHAFVRCSCYRRSAHSRRSILVQPAKEPDESETGGCRT